jgi:hypothetical protein
MPVTEPFRITPNLGPDLHQTSPYYWAEIHGQNSYQPGVRVIGNDGHEYIHVIAGATFAAEAGVEINETTRVATADASTPEWEAPVAVAEGAWFHARRIALPDGS